MNAIYNPDAERSLEYGNFVNRSGAKLVILIQKSTTKDEAIELAEQAIKKIKDGNLHGCVYKKNGRHSGIYDCMME